jgi:ParB family chromosome partitioning protein
VRRTALGRGLESIIPSIPEGERLAEIGIDSISPNPYQPRSSIDDSAIDELAESIKRHGVIQPIVVRPSGDGYQIVVGERRWLAAKRAGLESIPARIVSASDEDMMVLALVENMQREDLNPMEQARAYRELSERFGMSQEEIARAVGKDRSTVANTMRLLSLPPEIQELVASGRITEGHARAILSIKDPRKQMEVCRRIMEKGMSVREVEEVSKGTRPSRAKSPYISALEEELQRIFSTNVVIKHRGTKGAIVIHYYSLEELDRILDMLRGRA